MNVHKILIHKLPAWQYVTHDEFTHKSTMSVSCPGPLSVVVAMHLCCTPLMICWNLYCGMAFHSMMGAFSNSCKELNGGWFSRMCLFTMHKTCSIGTKSGARLGHGNVLILLACKKIMERQAVCDQASSCWKTKRLFLCMSSITTGRKCHRSSAVHSVFVLSESSWSFLRNVLLATTITNCHQSGQVA